MLICVNQLCLLGLASYLPLILADNATTLEHSVDFRVGFHVSKATAQASKAQTTILSRIKLSLGQIVDLVVDFIPDGLLVKIII
jgi:hypothetical protein